MASTGKDIPPTGVTAGPAIPMMSTPAPALPPPDPATVLGRKPRRWKPVIAVLALAGILVGGLWWIGSKVKSPEQRAAEAAAPVASPIGVPVEYRVLADTIITRGDRHPTCRR